MVVVVVHVNRNKPAGITFSVALMLIKNDRFHQKYNAEYICTQYCPHIHPSSYNIQINSKKGGLFQSDLFQQHCLLFFSSQHPSPRQARCRLSSDAGRAECGLRTQWRHIQGSVPVTVPRGRRWRPADCDHPVRQWTGIPVHQRHQRIWGTRRTLIKKEWVSWQLPLHFLCICCEANARCMVWLNQWQTAKLLTRRQWTYLYRHSCLQVCCGGASAHSCTDQGTKWVDAPITSHQGSLVTISASGCNADKVLGLRYAWRITPCHFKQCAVYAADTSLPAPPYLTNTLPSREPSISLNGIWHLKQRQNKKEKLDMTLRQTWRMLPLFRWRKRLWKLFFGEFNGGTLALRRQTRPW